MRTREHLIWALSFLISIMVVSGAVWYPAHERLAIVERMQEVKPVCAPVVAPRLRKRRIPDAGHLIAPGQYEAPGSGGE